MSCQIYDNFKKTASNRQKQNQINQSIIGTGNGGEMKSLGRFKLGILSAALLAGLAITAPTSADDKKVEDGKWTDKDGNPTYSVQSDGTADWYTFSGFRRYHAECHVCHGPEGGGSTYAPPLVDSVKRMSYDEFKTVIIQGRKRVDAADNFVMPSFGENLNVVCYIDDIWTYLKAKSDGAIQPGRPNKHGPKPATAAAYEDSCMGLGQKKS
jgi:methanol metabolism-related c-type cytochrome